MIRYVLGRVAQTVPLLFLLSVIAFGMLTAAPGDPAQSLLQAGRGGAPPKPADIARVRHNLGLDDPVVVRYVRWLDDALHGDFGTSYIKGRPISAILRDVVPPTLVLTGTALVMTVLLALVLGLAAGLSAGTWLARGISALVLALYSVPTFLIALVGILLFSVRWHVLPSSGMTAAGAAIGVGEVSRHVILPALALALGHPLGTDTIGRDLLSRTLYGGRISLSVGVLAAGMSLLLGVLVGALAGMSPAWLDAALMRSIDALLTLPLLVVIIAVEAIAQPSLTSVVLVIGATSWMPMARVVRAEFLTLRERDFVRAAVSLGTPRGTIARRHILPNALPPVLVVAAFQVSHAVMTESTLSFLGLRVPPHKPTWGNMLTAAQQHVLTGEWWTFAWPGLAIVLTVLSVNLVADGVRRRSDPRAWSNG